MADKLTVARPYARAAFQEARGEDRLAQWSDSLKVAAQVVKDPRVDNLLDRHYENPIGFLQPSIGVYAGLKVRL